MTSAPFTLGDLSRVLAQDEMTPSRGPGAYVAASTPPSLTSRKMFRWLAVFVSMFAGTAHGFLPAPAAGGVGDMRRGWRGQGCSSCATSGRTAASVSPPISCVGFETTAVVIRRWMSSYKLSPALYLRRGGLRERGRHHDYGWLQIMHVVIHEISGVLDAAAGVMGGCSCRMHDHNTTTT